MDLSGVLSNAYDQVRKVKGITGNLIFERFDKGSTYAVSYELDRGWKPKFDNDGSVEVKLIRPMDMPDDLIESAKAIQIEGTRYYFGRKIRPVGDLRPYYLLVVSSNRSDRV